MTAKKIPSDIQQQVVTIIEQFNQQNLKGCSKYTPRFKGAFLYLDRSDYGSPASQICRLKFMGALEDWEFAIFKYSSNVYDPEEWFFLGIGHLMEVLKEHCGVEWRPIQPDILAVLVSFVLYNIAA